MGTIFIFAFEWSHTVARIWLYAGLVVTIVCLGLALVEWKRNAEQELEQMGGPARRRNV